MTEFTSKVVLVTGAGLGVGRAVAEAFAGRGAFVAINDITPINLDETGRRIADSGGTVKDFVFDVAKRMPARALVEEVLETWGRIDILVNHASVKPRAAILDMDEWDWQRTLDVNLSAPFYLMQQAGRAMREQGGGVIVNIGPTAGGARGLEDLAAYVASKSGLIGLSREAAREFAEYNIRVNVVCTGGIEGRLSPGQPAEQTMQPNWGEDAPPLRPIHPEDVAGPVLFLCSQAAAHINGQVINVGGGVGMC